MIAESFHTDTSFIAMSVYSAPQNQYDVKTDFKVAHTGPIADSGRCYQVLLATVLRVKMCTRLVIMLWVKPREYLLTPQEFCPLSKFRLCRRHLLVKQH